METKGFFAGLLDFSFTNFITRKLIGVLYVIALIAIVLTSLGMLVAALAKGTALAMLVAIVTAVVTFCISVLALRVWLELLVVIFCIADNTTEIADHMRHRRANPAAGE